MATITLNDANNDGTGINLLTYFSTWETTFDREYWGFFSDSSTDFSGRQFAFADTDSSADTIAEVGSADTVVVDSGAANGLYYDYVNHVLAGAVDGVSFGSGLSYDSGSDTFSQSTWDIDISGLGVTGTGSGNDVHNLVWGLMGSDTSELLDVLDSQNNTIISSSGDDVVQGYSNIDTFVFESGGWGDDTIWYFTDGQDLLDLSAYGFDDLTDFTTAGGTISGNGTTAVTLAYSGNSIEIHDNGVNSITISDSDFA